MWEILVLNNLWGQAIQVEQIPYSQFQAYLKEGRIEEINITQNYIRGKLKDPQEGQPEQFITVRVEPKLADKLITR